MQRCAALNSQHSPLPLYFTPLYLYSSCSSSHTKLGIAHCLSPNAHSPGCILGQTTMDQFAHSTLFLYCCKHVRLFAQHVLSSPHVYFHHFHFLCSILPFPICHNTSLALFFCRDHISFTFIRNIHFYYLTTGLIISYIIHLQLGSSIAQVASRGVSRFTLC